MFVTGTEKELPVLPADAPLLRGIIARAGSVGEVMLLPSEVDRLRALAELLDKLTRSDVGAVRDAVRQLDDPRVGHEVTSGVPTRRVVCYDLERVAANLAALLPPDQR